MLAAGSLTMGWSWLRCQTRVGIIARGMHKGIRCVNRSASSFRESLHHIEVNIGSASMPTDRGDDSRFAMLDRLLAVLRVVEYSSIAILVDRVDEPTVVAGDVDHMRSLVVPLLSSRFLQHRGLAVKLLCPRNLATVLVARTARSSGRRAWTNKIRWSVCSGQDQCWPKFATPEFARPRSVHLPPWLLKHCLMPMWAAPKWSWRWRIAQIRASHVE